MNQHRKISKSADLELQCLGADQPQLFAEVIENVTTPDQPFEDIDGGWGSKVSRPPGKGWRISDFSHDRQTRWMRRRPIAWSSDWRGR